METERVIDAVVELADNGYILWINDIATLYQTDGDVPSELCANVLADLDILVDECCASKFRVHVEITPINNNDNENERKNE